MTTYICAYVFTCFIYELYVDETEINYETIRELYNQQAFDSIAANTVVPYRSLKTFFNHAVTLTFKEATQMLCATRHLNKVIISVK